MSTVDEFGRVIPAASGAAAGPSIGRVSASPPHRPHSPTSYYGSAHPAHPPAHHHHHHHDDRDRYYSNPAHHAHHAHHHHHHHPRSAGWGKRPRSPSTGSYSEQPTSHRASRARNPAFRYTEEPMLCEFVWKTSKEAPALIDGDTKDSKADDKKEEEDKKEDAATGEKTDGEDMDNDEGSKNDNKANDAERSKIEKLYADYRRRYCLNYVRSFFNIHMDDSWFRSRYSPLRRKRQVLAERKRAFKEAKIFKDQMETSLDRHQADNNSDRCSFVIEARLGGGVKGSISSPRKSSHSYTYVNTSHAGVDSTSSSKADESAGGNKLPKSHALSIADSVLHIVEIPPHVTDEQLEMALMDHAKESNSKDVEVKLYSGSISTDRNKNHLWREAFFVAPEAVHQEIIAKLQKAQVEASSNHQSSTNNTSNANNSNNTSSNPNGTNNAETVAATPVAVPRKADEAKKDKPTTLPLDVECSDSYGREDIDDDGKGKAPKDGVGVPNRKSTVWVKTHMTPQHILVLSAALSSKERIGRDKEAAVMIARALDVSKNVPMGNRLDDLLPLLFGNESDDSEGKKMPLSEDTLDVAIAYLRRVHLFSFYNGCTLSPCIADVLSGRHAAGTIHLRQQNADEVLEQAAREEKGIVTVDSADSKKEEKPNDQSDQQVEAPKKSVDLLVKRLDDSVARALEECNQWVSSGGQVVVSEQVDHDADDLEKAEEDWKDTWLENHAMIDEDGKARCSFHFCHKLFKDRNFLRKHLLKKHGDFLRAEQAQLHDEYMMKAWDEEESRPVPPVLVDCGAVFGLIPSPVVGAVPIATDPEPELWRKEEERRKQQESERERNEHRRRTASEDAYGSGAGGSGAGEENGKGTPRGSSNRVKHFVDVDDMKEEKVEMAFDDVEVKPPPKKKKKKKKLL